jgi:hypothetical protein
VSWTRLSALIVKELLAAFRDPRTRAAIILPAFVQFFLFAYAATLEVSNVPVGVLNEDWGMASIQLIERFERALAFSGIRRYESTAEAEAAIDRQDIMVVVHIGQDFSRKLASGETPQVQLLLDGRKSNSAQLVNNYIGTIISQFGAEYSGSSTVGPPSDIVNRTWYNPNREYQTAMVPTLIASLTMATVLLIVGMSVARERELGTLPYRGVGARNNHHNPRRSSFWDPSDRLRIPSVWRLVCVPTGDGWSRALHFVSCHQPAPGNDGHHGLHGPSHDTVGLHCAYPEYAELAAADCPNESAYQFHCHFARGIPTRHAVLAVC